MTRNTKHWLWAVLIVVGALAIISGVVILTHNNPAISMWIGVILFGCILLCGAIAWVKEAIDTCAKGGSK